MDVDSSRKFLEYHRFSHNISTTMQHLNCVLPINDSCNSVFWAEHGTGYLQLQIFRYVNQNLLKSIKDNADQSIDWSPYGIAVVTTIK